MIPGRPLIPYVIATAGHIDHGKSALVKALTGTDPDRLPEEKRRGITIDLGFAHLRLPSPANVQPGVEYVVGIVDVPGHEHFVKNMVAGVGSIDAALLVVAADDGWMPQTEEHVQILRYLGVKRAVIALAKADLGDVDVAVGSVCEHLAQTPFKDAPIIATSTVTGGGIEELKRSIAQMLAAIAPQRDLGKPRLPVDRVFSLKGIGTVVTGTLTGGKLRTGQMVCIQPANVPARVRSIQTHNREVEAGEPGSRVALNLPDIHAVGDRGKRAGHGVGRGDVITVADLGPPTSLLDALVERFGEMPQSRALRSSTVVRIHHGSASVPARIYLLGGNRLEAPGQSLARFTLQTPIFAFVGDRFVIRDWAEQHTLGGGIVLDFPVTSARPRRPIAGSAAWQLLEARAAAPDDLGAFVRTQIERDGFERDHEGDRRRNCGRLDHRSGRFHRGSDRLVQCLAHGRSGD
jgi:selenocysteine-specific elongation factor